jgi:beta-carotene 15,15'-dioxygenase
VPWTSLALAVLLGLLAGKHSENLAAVILLAGIFFNGLPHGGYDFWVMRDETAHRENRFLRLFAYLAAYIALAALTVVLWLWWAELALTVFLLVTAWHFGSGDSLYESDNFAQWILNGFGRGLILVCAPVLFHFESSAVVFRTMTATSVTSPFWTWLPSAVFYGLLTGLLFQIGGSLVGGLRQSKINAEFLKWSETVFLILTFWLTSPLLAVTCYFIGVHSWRHIFKITKTIDSKNLLQTLYHYHWRAFPLVLFSLLGLLSLFWLQPFRLQDLLQWTSAYLILLSALTIPHVLLITRIDARAFLIEEAR